MDAGGKASKKTLSYQKLIGGVTHQPLNQISIDKLNKENANSPEQRFLDTLDNLDALIP